MSENYQTFEFHNTFTKTILGEDFNSKFFFDCHNNMIYIEIYIY